jgi:hypothetical protein
MRRYFLHLRKQMQREYLVHPRLLLLEWPAKVGFFECRRMNALRQRWQILFPPVFEITGFYTGNFDYAGIAGD